MKPSGKKENATEKLILFSSEVDEQSFAEVTAMIQFARLKACHQSMLLLSTYTEGWRNHQPQNHHRWLGKRAVGDLSSYISGV